MAVWMDVGEWESVDEQFNRQARVVVLYETASQTYSNWNSPTTAIWLRDIRDLYAYNDARRR